MAVHNFLAHPCRAAASAENAAADRLCQCAACVELRARMPQSVGHLSHCAVHNEPAYPAGPCNCGATQ